MGQDAERNRCARYAASVSSSLRFKPSYCFIKALGTAVRETGICHRPVNLAQGVRVVAGVYPVQNVNAFDRRLKEWMRRFHGVATRHLPNYLRAKPEPFLRHPA